MDSTSKKVLSLAARFAPVFFVLLVGIASAQAAGGAPPGTAGLDSLNTFIHAWGVKLTLTGLLLVGVAVAVERQSDGIMHNMAVGVARVALGGTVITAGATILQFFGVA